MCVTAVIAGAALVASAVGTYSSIQANNAQADAARTAEAFKRKQLAEQAEMNRLAARQKELARMDQYAAERSTALATIGAAGLGDHISFFQGIEPSNRDSFNDEIRAIRLNMIYEEGQIADSIEVSEYASQMASFNAKMSNVGAIAGFASDVMGAYSFYNQNKAA